MCARKGKRVAAAFSLFPALRDTPVLPCAPAPAMTGYRTRVKCAVGPVRAGRAALGLYRQGTHEVVDVPQCRVIAPELLPILEDLRTRIPGSRVPVAHLDLRWSMFQHAAHVTLVASRRGDDPRFVRFARELMQAQSAVAGVAIRHAGGGPVIRPLSGQTVALAGEQHLTERVGRFLFRLSPGSFFQASPAGALQLLETVAAWSAPSATAGRLVDLFAGAGLFAVGLADRVHAVTAVESAPQAADDARASAALSGAKIEVLHTTAENICGKIAGMRPDLLILDPPRRGVALTVLEAAAAAGPGRMLYVACDPETLARDAAVLAACGYRPMQAAPLDLFPLTGHVETVLLLERRPIHRAPAARYRDAAVLITDKSAPVALRKRAAVFDPYPRVICMPAADITGMEVHATPDAAVRVQLEYLALVKGIPHRHGNLPCRKETGRAGRNRYRLLCVIAGYALVRISANAASHHEILRQLWQIGHPVLGGERFGDRRTNRFLAETCCLHRPLLHVHRVTVLGIGAKPLVRYAPLPADFRLVLRRLRGIRGSGGAAGQHGA